MEVTLIASVSRDGFISRGQGVPWHLPEDVRHFRTYCQDKWLLAGRRTFEEMRGWFQPGHTPVVITRQPDYPVPAGHAAPSIPAALHIAREAGAGECVVIGGGAIYAAALPFATRLILTEVDTLLEAGVPFPPVRAEEWQEVSARPRAADAQHAFAFTIRHLVPRA